MHGKLSQLPLGFFCHDRVGLFGCGEGRAAGVRALLRVRSRVVTFTRNGAWSKQSHAQWAFVPSVRKKTPPAFSPRLATRQPGNANRD
jgi:hypothetical protein